jgi:hypothetical protein
VASKKTRRLIAIGAFAAAAAAGPAVAASTLPAAPQDYQAYPGECLAWFGNQEDGKCLGYSNGTPISGGTPSFGYGPNGGVSTGPVLPGTSVRQGIISQGVN